MRSVRPIAVTIAGVLLVGLGCNSVRAEIRVQGQAGDLRIEARDATVAEILAVLGERFALQFRGTTASTGITATFEGPLRRVVARVLEGYDYVMTAHGDGLEVVVLSTSSRHAVTPPPVAPPTMPAKVLRRNE
jgi:hypothetical protein